MKALYVMYYLYRMTSLTDLSMNVDMMLADCNAAVIFQERTASSLYGKSGVGYTVCN